MRPWSSLVSRVKIDRLNASCVFNVLRLPKTNWKREKKKEIEYLRSTGPNFHISIPVRCYEVNRSVVVATMQREEICILQADHASSRMTIREWRLLNWTEFTTRKKVVSKRKAQRSGRLFVGRKCYSLPGGGCAQDRVTTISWRLCFLPAARTSFVATLRNLIAHQRKRNALFSCLYDNVRARKSALNRLRNVARRQGAFQEKQTKPDREEGDGIEKETTRSYATLR